MCATGSITEGCLDSNAFNFNPLATSENGDCVFATIGFNCNGTFHCLGGVNGKNVLEVADFLELISEFGCDSACLTDVSNDDAFSIADVLIVLSGFGATCE